MPCDACVEAKARHDMGTTKGKREEKSDMGEVLPVRGGTEGNR